MGAAADINRDQLLFRRVQNLVGQFGLSSSESAGLLRSIAEGMDPTERIAELRAVAEKARPVETDGTATSGAERTRLCRLRKREGVQPLTIYVSNEGASVLAARGLIPMAATESKSGLRNAIQQLIVELVDAAR